MVSWGFHHPAVHAHKIQLPMCADFRHGVWQNVTSAAEIETMSENMITFPIYTEQNDGFVYSINLLSTNIPWTPLQKSLAWSNTKSGSQCLWSKARFQTGPSTCQPENSRCVRLPLSKCRCFSLSIEQGVKKGRFLVTNSSTITLLTRCSFFPKFFAACHISRECWRPLCWRPCLVFTMFWICERKGRVEGEDLRFTNIPLKNQESKHYGLFTYSAKQ